MASPVDAGRATTSVATGADPWTVNLPASIAAGDLLLVWLCNQGASTFNLPAGWSWLLNNRSQPNSGDTLACMYRLADGSEGATVSVDLTAAVKGAAIAWRITGAEDPATQAPEISAAHDTTGTNTANPPSISPTGGSKDYLFFVVAEMDGEAITGFSHSVYVNDQATNSGTAGAAGTNLEIGGASRQATTATEDPAVWTHGLANSGVTAYTIAIHPGATATPKAASDSFALTEGTAAIGLSRTDAGSLSEAAAIAATVAANDSAALAEAIASIALARTDSFALAEAATAVATEQKVGSESF